MKVSLGIAIAQPKPNLARYFSWQGVCPACGEVHEYYVGQDGINKEDSLKVLKKAQVLPCNGEAVELYTTDKADRQWPNPVYFMNIAERGRR